MSDSAPLTTCPPWLLPCWHAVYKRHEAGKLPHAMLFTGMPGIGKKQFVRFVQESLLCRNTSPDTGACGQCDACAQLVAMAHPERFDLQPGGKSMTISVDSVRELVSWLQLSAPAGQYRTALIDQADTMNRNAANSLLKTLEEPGARVVLLLAADQAGVLPATIRSRCQQTVLNLADKQAAINWLEAEGVSDAAALVDTVRAGPIAILDQQSEEWRAEQNRLQKAWSDLLLMRASVGKIVDSLNDLPATRCLDNFSRFAMLASKVRLAAPIGVDHATSKLISEVHETLDSEQWFSLYDRMQSLNRSMSASFKTQTVLEGLFADIRLMTQG